MPEVGSTWITVLPDMTRWNRDLSRQATTSGDSAGKTFGSGFAKAAAVGIAVFGAARIFSGFIADAQESARVSRLTENAIRATGGAANVTAKQVSDLATSLSNKTAIDDELVQSGANLILTFKNIRNEAGAGNDIFDRTTEAALNLSAAGFGSVESASVMLGKALNDPLAGLTALSRAGVTFSEQQKEQIRVLTESGDLLGAQRVILDEVAGQVGGAAEAAADPMARLGVTVDNLGETIGTALLPSVEAVAGFIGDTLIPGMRELFTALGSGESTATGFAGVMGDVGVVLGNVVGFIKDNVSWLGPLAIGIGAAVLAIKAWSAAQLILNLALNANPITLVITVIGLLVAAFIYAWQNSETFRDVVTGVLDAIGTAFSFVWNSILSPVFTWIGEATVNVGQFFTGMGDVIGRVWSAVGNALVSGWNWIRDNVFTPFQNIFTTIGNAFATFGDTVGSIWASIQRIFVDAVNGVIGFINGFLDAINWVGEQVGLDFNLHIGYLPVPGLGPGVGGPGSGRGLAFATGGKVPGEGSGDTVPAWLTPGEIVIRKDIAKPFEDFLLALNSGQAEAIQAAGGRGARGPQRFAGGGTVASAQEWARQNAGRPYIWGGVGPGGWDCSGWMSDIANHLLGTTMHQRRFATASMSGGVNAGGFVRGLDNEFTIGVNPGSHTAGTLGGINVESGSGHGGIIGGNALGTKSRFQYQYYLPGSYGFDVGAEARAAQMRYSVPSSGNLVGDLVAGIANFMMSGVTGAVSGLDPDTPVPQGGLFDRGGILKSGDIAMNRSGHDELILDPSQTAGLLGGGTVRLVGTLDLGDGLTGKIDARIVNSDETKTRDRRSGQRVSR